MTLLRRNWIVKLRVADDDPLAFGPYTQPRAELLAGKLNERIEAVDEGERGYMHATAFPLSTPSGIRELAREAGLGA